MDKKSFNLLDREAWNDVFFNKIKLIIPEKIIEIIKESPPEYFDDLDWFDGLINIEFRCGVDLKTQLVDFLVSEYDFIRAFHATRIDGVGSFYERGLCPLVLEEIEDKARQIFTTKLYPEISADRLNDAIEKSRQYQTGEVWFHLNKNYLINEANHYFEFFGGEHLQSIAANLSNCSSSYKDELKCIGHPVVFECDIPIRFIKIEYLKEVSRVIFVEIMYDILDGCCEKDGELCDIDFSLEIRQILPPEFIVSHQILNIN